MQQNNKIQELRKNGNRMTPQRAIIIDVIKREKTHISKVKIIEEIKKTQPFINTSTIYRTLSFLTKQRVINEIRNPAGSEYEYVTNANHQHLICRNCQSSIEIQADIFNKLQSVFKTRYGFSIDLNHIALYGLCKKCVNKIKK